MENGTSGIQKVAKFLIFLIIHLYVQTPPKSHTYLGNESKVWKTEKNMIKQLDGIYFGQEKIWGSERKLGHR